MSEPLEIIAPAEQPTQPRRGAVIALLIACLAWGGSFTWAKAIMAAMNVGRGDATLGVFILLSWRSLIAGAIWMLIFPAARSGWTRASLGRVILLGLPLTIGMTLQQLGLTLTTEAVNAFLTSLNAMFVPLILAVVTFKIPNRGLIFSIVMAVAGIWLLSAAGRTGFGWGEILGVGCSILFSVHIILINTLITRDSPARMVGGQFLFIGLTMLVLSLAILPDARKPGVMFLPFASNTLLDFTLLVIVSTVLAFGLMLTFQPRVDPTRAALIYLTEPIFAAAYAWIFAGRGLKPAQLAGAGLIVCANTLVEWLGRRRPIVNMANPAANSTVEGPGGQTQPLVLTTRDAKMPLPVRGPTD